MSEERTAAERAPDAASAVGALLAHVRHELRTPINAIIGYSEMLLEDAAATGHGGLQPDLERIHELGERLLALVNEILDGARGGDSPDINLDDFGSKIRYQLRVPLNAVVGYSELLLEGGDDLGPAFVADLQRIRVAGRRLMSLSEDIVNFSRGGAGSLNLEVASPAVSDMIRNVVSQIQPQRAEAARAGGRVLVVDDNEMNRDVLRRRLERQGHTVAVAEDGAKALGLLGAEVFDLILLDVMMPEMSGYELLQRLKADPRVRDIPVVMVSALGTVDSVVRCIEMGAEDYLPKPLNPVLLKARVDACLEKKRLRDQEQAHLQALRVEREKSERLLHNVLPQAVVERLREGKHFIAERFDDATVIFSDLVGFTQWSSKTAAVDVVHMLNELFSVFDYLAERWGLEKIKTIGDCYMAAGGLPTRRDDHAEAVAEMALDMHREIARFNHEHGSTLEVRTGIHTGPVVAGIIGKKKFIYDLWGDTVNTASRMESHGLPGRIQVTLETYERLKGKYLFDERVGLEVKGKGAMTTYLLTSRR